jgi:hypothetical protein
MTEDQLGRLDSDSMLSPGTYNYDVIALRSQSGASESTGTGGQGYIEMLLTSMIKVVYESDMTRMRVARKRLTTKRHH